MKTYTFLLGAILAAGLTQSTRAAAPVEVPLKAEIVADTPTYELDPAMAGKDFAEKVRAAEKGNRAPATRPPKVNLTLRLTNTGQSDCSLRIGGDESNLDLELKGPGALSIAPRMMMTMEFRMGKAVTLKPGEHQDIPIKSLASGQRELGKFSYWTEPGEYTLAATFNGRSAGNQIKVRAEPVKLKVVEAGKAPAPGSSK
jgi:hypothetical protein